MESNDEGTKNSGELVSIGGKLPLLRELRTSQLLDFFVALSANKEKNLRKRINQWLYPKTRPGFYMEIKPNLHLAYADQRDGHGTQHWWRLFFDQDWQERIEQIVRGSALVVGRSNNGTTEWGGMYFRSPVEVKIAEALDRRGLLFFGNARGRIGGQGSPLSASTMTGRLEIDFLVFHKGKCINLEIDGKHHQENGQTHRDYIRDRLLLREGIATARFTAQECMESPDAAIEEFLNLF